MAKAADTTLAAVYCSTLQFIVGLNIACMWWHARLMDIILALFTSRSRLPEVFQMTHEKHAERLKGFAFASDQ